MKVAVFINGNRFILTCAEESLRLILKIDTHPPILCLDVNECDEVLRKHRMRYASDFNLDCTVIDFGNYRYMLFIACIYRVRNHFRHLLSAAYDRHLGIHDLDDDVAAMTASVEFCCHTIHIFNIQGTVYQIAYLNCLKIL